MTDITATELIERIVHRTASLPGEHSTRQYSKEELQEAVATLATCVNRLASLVGRLIESTAKDFARTDKEYPIKTQ